MLMMSRKCVPYTPVAGNLSELAVALVSSTGVYLEGMEPFGDDSDESFRVLPGDMDASLLRFKHGHFDESHANQDPNVVFPVDLLRELAAEGAVRKLSNKHIGFKGFSVNLKNMYEKVAPAIAVEIERSQADCVVLTGG